MLLLTPLYEATVETSNEIFVSQSSTYRMLQNWRFIYHMTELYFKDAFNGRLS